MEQNNFSKKVKILGKMVMCSERVRLMREREREKERERERERESIELIWRSSISGKKNPTTSSDLNSLSILYST